LIFRAAGDAGYAAVPRGLPVQLVGGGADPSTERGRVVERLAQRMRRMGFSNLVSTIYEQTRHESLNELNRDVKLADLTEWWQRSVAPRRHDAESSCAYSELSVTRAGPI